MSDQTLDTIGKLLESSKPRDAVHFAVASITAAMRLNPGQHVGLFSYYGKYEDEGTRFDLLLSQAEHGGFGTDIEYGDDCQPTDEFWNHFERYTGKKVAQRHKHFRCAC